MRWLPSSARLYTLPEAAQLTTALVSDCTARCWGIAPERFHQTGRFPEELQRALIAALETQRALLDALVLAVARRELPRGTELAVQEKPYARVVPPRCPEAVKAFHWDAYVGHPRRQWGLWVPLVDIEGDEGLWLVDDELVTPWLARGELTQGASDAMRAAARPVPMSRGEVLVLQSHTGHGSVPHSLDRTRLSFDVRFAIAGEEPRGAIGWKARRLTV